MMRQRIVGLFVAVGLAVLALLAGTAAASAATTVPGQSGKSGDVSGHYTSVYAYDATGAYYWDLGDGRVDTSPGVTSPTDLDPETLSTCVYVVNYRGDFGNDPFLDSGRINNHVNCSGYDGNLTVNYVIVSKGQPQYDGDPSKAVWDTWEYQVSTESGNGNVLAHSTNPSHQV